MPRCCRLFSLALLVLAPASLFAAKKDSLSPSELFTVTNVYTAHFRFSVDQWEAMEPEQSAAFEGRRPRGGGARGGAGGPPRFGPGMFMAPVFMNAADTDRDGKLTRDEFASLGERWFTAFDKEKSGVLKGDQLRDGLNARLGGGGPRIMLQGRDGQRNGLASAMGVEFDYVKADFEFAGRTFTNVAVRYKGNGTWMQSQGSLKRSLKVDLNEFVKGQKIAGISKLNFHNCVTDGAWMNEVLAHRFYRDIGVAAPRTAYARVYVTVPGKHDKTYLGLYSLVENIDENFTDERFGTKKGAIFKPVTPQLFTFLGDDWNKYKQTYDPKDDPAMSDCQWVIDFARLVTSAGDEEFAAKAPEYLDLDQFANYMAGTVWLATLDSILSVGQNYYLYLEPKTRKFQFFPWDLDHSFGQFFLMGTQDQRNELSLEKPWRGENRFLERVFKLDAFKKPYRTRLKQINETIGAPGRITSQVDNIAAAIRPAIEAESKDKLDRFDKLVAGESAEPPSFGGPGGRGRGPGGPGGFGQVQPIKKFVVARHKSVTDQLAGTSKGADLDAPAPGMQNFGPGTFLAPALQGKFDADKDNELSRAEFTDGFKSWFAKWDAAKAGELTEDKLRDALDAEFMPPAGIPGGAGGPGAPNAGRPSE